MMINIIILFDFLVSKKDDEERKLGFSRRETGGERCDVLSHSATLT
jgi:hypothetical protein